MENPFSDLRKIQEHFKTELICARFIEQNRWNGNPECPHCKCTAFYRTKTRFKHPELKNYKDFLCKNCLKKYSVTTGTIYESSKIEFKIWFQAFYFIFNHKKGISSIQLGKDLKIGQKAAWFILQRIRFLMKKKETDKMGGVIMGDESFIGGKNKNRRAHKKVLQSQGRSTKDKTPVFGLMQGGGDIRTQVVADTKATTLRPIINEMVKQGAILITDEWKGYAGLKKDYRHVVINHDSKEFTRGAFHVNNVENFWSILKRGVYGIYHQVSPKHLHRYCDEFSFRYNLRNLKSDDMINAGMQNIENRLTYKQLIGK